MNPEQVLEDLFQSKSNLDEFIKSLKKQGKFDLFFDHEHNLGPTSGISFINDIQFANAIIARAKKIGVNQAFKELDDYLASNQNLLECGLLLYNIHIDNEFQFTNGVSIINTSSLKSSDLTNFLSKECISTGGLNTAFLVIDYPTKKKFDTNIDSGQKNSTTDWSDLNEKTRLIGILDDTRLLISLARHPDYGIPVVGSFEIVPDSLSMLNNGVSYSPFPEPRQGMGPSLLAIEFTKSQKLIDQFDLLSADDQDKIRVVLRRLNDVKIDSNWANMSINLRICLENLFYSGDGPIAKTISERAPQYTSFSKNRTRNVYKFLSSAVHTGRPAQHDNITVKEITEQIHQTVLIFLNNGKYPAWPTQIKPNRLKKLVNLIISFFNN